MKKQKQTRDRDSFIDALEPFEANSTIGFDDHFDYSFVISIGKYKYIISDGDDVVLRTNDRDEAVDKYISLING